MKYLYYSPKKYAVKGGLKIWRWHILDGFPLFFLISPLVLRDFKGGWS